MYKMYKYAMLQTLKMAATLFGDAKSNRFLEFKPDSQSLR